ncbi:P-loop containing nucleoside triphosphate hydrolase protein [Lentinus tigrinus ALCF2SS1-7]|uniref:P-loop containing nucleoside triphosphate hydrolase protein n=1 Tax=Lentinus tigrinus ALCF2SS1-6 TaxID=1328759 RepID=A0A5C2RVC1_9APHY|nr:P-loop containing nucleoside triphosphate hydrolase protein [Lentinus tigrinus ALCF2SS1-6]RPD72523.1 P-loop containing nucleoside triphosphate hydrolase protein [Lentinus tigrinus ALCF2SS1-7]
MPSHQSNNAESTEGDQGDHRDAAGQSEAPPVRECTTTDSVLHTATADASPAPIVPPDQQVVLLLVGLIGSGKSTFAQALERHFPQFHRCSQDDLGDRRSVEALARRSLRGGLSVIIDRTNFDESQRATWINIAHEFPNAVVWVLVFDTPYEVCAARVAERAGHPTITSPELGLQVLQRFRSQYRPPAPHEGYTRILHLKPSDLPDPEYSEAVVRDVMRRLQDTPEVVASLPPASGPRQYGGYRDFRGGYRGFGPPRRGFEPRGPSYRGRSSSSGAYRGVGTYQSTLQWNRALGGSEQGTPWQSHRDSASGGRRPYQPGRDAQFDPSQGDWRRS